MERFKAGFPSDLTEDQSPTIPKDFPKDKIPKNICEIEFMSLFRCFQVLGTQMQCSNEYKKFIECKQERDMRLFQSIQNWEINHFQSLTPENRRFYVMGMNNKLNRLEKEFEQIPGSAFYRGDKIRFQSDIDQYRWRIRYLKNIPQK